MALDPKRTYLIYAVTVLLLFGVLAQLLGPIQWTREAEGTAETGVFESDEPWSLVGSLLLAGFRAIAVDWLWVKAMDAQQEGNWHEIVLLTNAIIQLQPRFEEAYIFNAWNMAYNISHEAETPEEKWGWIMAGYNLMREGARKNPQAYRIKFWAGWILFDKIAQDYNYAKNYTDRYMKENHGRHPVRDGALWFERAYRTPVEQLWAHRMMMSQAYVRLAEYYYVRKDERLFREALKSMFRACNEILSADPEEEVSKELLGRWSAYLRLRAVRFSAQEWLGAKPEEAVKNLKEAYDFWLKELEGNPYGIVANAEAAETARLLAKDALERDRNEKEACSYLEKAYKSVGIISGRYRGYDEVQEELKSIESLLLKHGCKKPEELKREAGIH